MRLVPLLAVLVGGPAWGVVRQVGEQAQYRTLDAAARAAEDGDTIHLTAGTYFQCAVLARNDLVLEGEGPDTIVTDTPCQGKGLVVAAGNNLVVRDLVLARVRVPDHNGAGIRLEGRGLTLQRVRFENDERGLLAAQNASGTVLIQDCVFSRGGVAGERPGYAVAVGPVDLLRIERTVFELVKGGQVSSDAARTELVGNTIGTGVEPSGGFAVNAGGALLMQDNVLVLGPEPPPRAAAVLTRGAETTLLGNQLRNGTGQPATLLLDWGGGTPRLHGNVLDPRDRLVGQDGVLRNRAGNLARGVAEDLRHAAGSARRALKAALGR